MFASLLEVIAMRDGHRLRMEQQLAAQRYQKALADRYYGLAQAEVIDGEARDVTDQKQLPAPDGEHA